uniref:Uncharacterized protein n=1 Tax=Glossina pallidipes TaxID=7398 RepID=A0A1B0AJH3_GLOPL
MIQTVNTGYRAVLMTTAITVVVVVIASVVLIIQIILYIPLSFVLAFVQVLLSFDVGALFHLNCNFSTAIRMCTESVDDWCNQCSLTANITQNDFDVKSFSID